MNERGRVYISNATINGSFALRACITNHRTTEEDLDMLIDEVETVAASLAEDTRRGLSPPFKRHSRTLGAGRRALRWARHHVAMPTAKEVPL